MSTAARGAVHKIQMAFCRWANPAPIPVLPAYSQSQKWWVPFNKNVVQELKHVADNPAFRAASTQIISRILSQGGIQLSHNNKMLSPPSDIRDELANTYSQVVDGIVMQILTFGVAFVCISGGKFGDEEPEGDAEDSVPAQNSTSSGKSVGDVIRDLDWNGARGRPGISVSGVAGFKVTREADRSKPFMLDLLNPNILVEYLAHPCKPTDYRVSIPDPRGHGQRLVLNGVLVVEVEPPSAVTGLNSPALRFMPAAVLAQIARSCAAVAMQRQAAPIVYTQQSNKGVDDGEGHDLHAVGDNFAAAASRVARNAAAADESAPLEARVAPAVEASESLASTVRLEQPLSGIWWNARHVSGDPRTPYAPIHLMNFEALMGPTCTVADGRQMVNGPVAQSPAQLGELLDNEVAQASLVLGVPASQFNPKMTATAVDEEARSFEEVVQRYSRITSTALTMLINAIFTLDELKGSKRGKKRGRSSDSDEEPLSEDLEDSDSDEKGVRVFFNMRHMPTLVFDLFERGFMGPEDARDYISNATGIPVSDLKKPSVTQNPATKDLVTTNPPDDPKEPGKPPKRRRFAAPGAAEILRESSEQYQRKREGKLFS